MSSQWKGRVHHLAPIKIPTHLPPKSPHFAPSPHFDCFTEAHKGASYSSKHTVGYEKYQNVSDKVAPTEPAWLNELLDSPKTFQKWPSHRRSASDTVAFLEAPSNSKKVDGIAEEDGFSSSKSPVRFRGSLDFDRLDEEHFMHLFSDLKLFEDYPGMDKYTPNQPHQAATTGVHRCTTESWNSELKVISNFDGSISAINNHCGDVLHEDVIALRGTYLSGGPELEREGLGDFYNERFISGDHVTLNLDANVDQDPHRTNRLSSRQSAQRSRVRKLQYIAELERRVHVLQTEVSTLSPQVAYLDHQRSILRADNNTLKQKITAVLNDKLFKDASIELMKKERQRLKLLFYQQRSRLASYVQQHSSVSNFHLDLMQDEETTVTDAFARLAKASNMAPSTQEVGVIRSWADKKTSGMKNVMQSSRGLAGKGLEAAVL